MTIFKPKCFVERRSIPLSIAELHFSLTTTHLTVGCDMKKVVYDVPRTSSIDDYWVLSLLWDSSNWKSGKFTTTDA